MIIDGSNMSPLERLTASFCPPLDETLVIPIAQDYDLDTEDGYRGAEAILRDLAEVAAVEQATEAYLIGAQKPDEQAERIAAADYSTASTSTSRQVSNARGAESSSTEASSTSGEMSESIPRLTLYDDAKEDTKIQALRDMFSDLKEFDVRYALQKSNDDFQRALDMLMDMQQLQSQGQLQRGIEGFFDAEDEGVVPPKGKGKKNKRNQHKRQTSQSPFLDSDLFADKDVQQKKQDKLLKEQEEIASLADKLDMSFDEVSDIYRRKKNSGAAAVAILDMHMLSGITAKDETGRKRAKELGIEHGNIPEEYLLTLVHVADEGACKEIALLMSQYFKKHPRKKRLDLLHRTTPLPNEELEGLPGTRSGTGNKARTPTSGPSRPSSPTRELDLASAVHDLNLSNHSRHELSTYATQLSRKGGSNGLYRQAAAVYRVRAQEEARNGHEIKSDMADLLVASSAKTNSIDLHGVGVIDGVRIAKAKTREWWDTFGEYRKQRARENPFTVITGQGRHSAGGRSQLRIAVLNALMAEGWDVRVETGSFSVCGRR